jgi:hypothetical protein
MTEVPKSEQSLDSRLDEALEMTFPASDPRIVSTMRTLTWNKSSGKPGA